MGEKTLYPLHPLCSIRVVVRNLGDPGEAPGQGDEMRFGQEARVRGGGWVGTLKSSNSTAVA